MKNDLTTLFSNLDLKLTPLRNDVMSIILEAEQPLSAYDILDRLRKIREGAEPPTVYRVLEFLVSHHIVHRIDSQNTYVLCSQREVLNEQHKTVLVVCDHCQACFEYIDVALAKSIEEFAQKKKIKINSSLIKLSGICEKCQ